MNNNEQYPAVHILATKLLETVEMSLSSIRIDSNN